MVMYEFSKTIECFFILIQLIPTLALIALIIKFGVKYISGWYKLLIILPVMYLSYATFNLYSQFEVVKTHENNLVSNSLTTFQGKLETVSHKNSNNFYNDPNESPVFVETLEFNNGIIKRFSPKLYAGENGCLSRTLEEELTPFIGKTLLFKYTERKLNNIKPSLICILKVQIIDD
jgi:hypothetical protein